MLCHLVSNDPDNYGTIRFTSSISKMNSNVMYRINSVSFIANFSITTNDDYMDIIVDESGTSSIVLHYQFKDHGKYDIDTLAYELNTLLNGTILETMPITFDVTINDTGLLTIKADKEFEIVNASHNVRMILGLYHSTFPIKSIDKKINCNSIPYMSFGNVLYLTCRTDMICSVNSNNGNEETLSIAYKTNEILYPGFPVNCKIPGKWSVIHSSQLNQLEFTLVDFQFIPVKLHSPLYITIGLSDQLCSYEF